MNEDEKKNESVEDESEKPTPAPSENPEPEKKSKPLSDLKTRLITAAFLAVLYVGGILLSIFVSHYFYDALVVFLMLMASTEFANAISGKFAKAMKWFVYATIVLGYSAFIFVHIAHGSGGITSFFGVLALVFIASIVYNMFSRKHTINNVISTLFVMIYPVTIMVYTLALNYLPLPQFSPMAIILVFGGTTLVDSMAYFVGSIVRGPKLCPTVSPKKTISGAIGGLIGGVGAALIIMVFGNLRILGCVPISTNTVINVIHFVVLGLGIAIFCQIGDLVSSYIKRACEIKDYGTLLKGHGGFMDRMDGVTVASVFVFIYFTILGMLC
ncbi:MAG: phosphatidate cytidylyltransferase [Clostridia bacterium]|nr:phosphatidate cytidylyltransferase [Clostridia bacterium]